MNFFVCWINLLTKSYQNQLYNALIGKGYTVGPSSALLSTSSDDHASYLICLKIGKPDPNLNCETIFNDVALILDGLKIFHFGVVVAKTSEFSWTGSNILHKKNFR